MRTEQEEQEILEKGAKVFFMVCEMHGMPWKDARGIWELAFKAGELNEGKKWIRRFEKFCSDLKVPRLCTAFLLLLALVLPGCGTAISADRPVAEQVFNTDPDFVCFIIRDEAGKGVGGNCVKR